MFLKIILNFMGVYPWVTGLYKKSARSLSLSSWNGIPGRGKCFSQGLWIGDRWWIFAFQHITVTLCTVWVYFQSPTQGLAVNNKLASKPISRKRFSMCVTLYHFPVAQWPWGLWGPGAKCQVPIMVVGGGVWNFGSFLLFILMFYLV